MAEQPDYWFDRTARTGSGYRPANWRGWVAILGFFVTLASLTVFILPFVGEVVFGLLVLAMALGFLMLVNAKAPPKT